MTSPIQKQWRGFVPAHYPHSMRLCAYYHCPSARVDGRYCQTHRDQYDLEALRTPTVILEFTTGGIDLMKTAGEMTPEEIRREFQDNHLDNDLPIYSFAGDLWDALKTTRAEIDLLHKGIAIEQARSARLAGALIQALTLLGGTHEAGTPEVKALAKVLQD